MNKWGRYGQRLKRARKKLDWSQDRLAQYFDLTQTAIGRYEKGQRTPDEPILIKQIRLFVKSVERATEQDIKGGILQYRKHRFDISRRCHISREKKARFPAIQIPAENPKCHNSRGDFTRKTDLTDFHGFLPPKSLQGPDTKNKGDLSLRTKSCPTDNISIPKSDGYCVVNGRLVYNFWRSPDPWKEAQGDAEIECECCHRRVHPECIDLYIEIKDNKSRELFCRESLAKFICEDCYRIERSRGRSIS
jgi:transcriptional regulator with XRE-family HTH domain